MEIGRDSGISETGTALSSYFSGLRRQDVLVRWERPQVLVDEPRAVKSPVDPGSQIAQVGSSQ